MKITKNHRAFTLVELLVGLVIGAIVILSVGVISAIGPSAHESQRKKSQVYNDVSYGFKLIACYVHKAKTIDNESWNPPGTWPNDMLVLYNDALSLKAGFGLNKSSNNELRLVYIPDTADKNTFEVILEKTDSLNFSFQDDPAGKIVTVRIWGRKDKELFDLSTKLTKRNG